MFVAREATGFKVLTGNGIPTVDQLSVDSHKELTGASPAHGLRLLILGIGPNPYPAGSAAWSERETLISDLSESVLSTFHAKWQTRTKNIYKKEED